MHIPRPRAFSPPSRGYPWLPCQTKFARNAARNPPSDAAAVFADARDGATIKDVAILRITAIEDS